MNYGKFRKLTGPWLKILAWLVILASVVVIQSGAFRPVEVHASIEISASVNEPIIEKVLPATGPVAGNTRVSISGTNFEDVIAVTFGGVNAAGFQIESPTLISAQTPPGQAGTVKVAVVTADKAAALNNAFTYIAPATATATAMPSLSPSIAPTPTNPVATVTVPVSITTPAATSPAQSTTSSEAASPSPTTSLEIVTVTPGNSPSPEATPTGTPSPQATVPGPTIAVEPTASPAVTITPAVEPTSTAPVTNTVTAITTPPLSPKATSTYSPAATASPTPTLKASPSPALTPTATPAATPTNPSLEVTATATGTPVATYPASVSPAVTLTTGASPTALPASTVTVTPGTPATPVATPTGAAETATPTQVIAPTPTVIIAPTATPAASPSPTPEAPVAGPPTISQVNPAFGASSGGTTVIIRGTNFTDQTQITFGGLYPASVIINSPTQITVVTAPQPAGKISIVVKTDLGLTSLADGFNYTAEKVEISQQPANFHYSGKLNGKVLVLKSSFSVGVKDLSGSAAGWHLVARSTVLSSGKNVIPVTNHTIQNVQVHTLNGTPPENKMAFPVVFPTSDKTIFTAAPNTGTGESIITFETQLIIPPDIPPGNYTLTLNVSVEEGVTLPGV